MAKKLRLFKGRSSKGIKGIELSSGDEGIDLTLVDTMDINPKTAKKLLKNGSSNKDKAAELTARQKYILSITENGFGKKTSFYDYRVTSRGGKGVKTINIELSYIDGMPTIKKISRIQRKLQINMVFSI